MSNYKKELKLSIILKKDFKNKLLKKINKNFEDIISDRIQHSSIGYIGISIKWIGVEWKVVDLIKFLCNNRDNVKYFVVQENYIRKNLNRLDLIDNYTPIVYKYDNIDRKKSNLKIGKVEINWTDVELDNLEN